MSSSAKYAPTELHASVPAHQQEQEGDPTPAPARHVAFNTGEQDTRGPEALEEEEAPPPQEDMVTTMQGQNPLAEGTEEEVRAKADGLQLTKDPKYKGKYQTLLDLLQALETEADKIREGGFPSGELLKVLEQVHYQSFRNQSLKSITRISGPTLEKLLIEYPDHQEVNQLVGQIVSNLCFMDACREYIARQKLFELILDSADRWAHHPPSLMAGLKSLGCFAADADLRKVSRDQGAMEYFVKALKVNKSPEVLKEASRGMINMSFLSGTQDTVASLNGVDALTEAMKCNMHQTQELTEGMRALYNLGYRHVPCKAQTGPKIPLICECISNHTQTETLVTYAAQTLINVCVMGEFNRTVAKDQGIMALITQAKAIKSPKLHNKLTELEEVIKGRITQKSRVGDAAPDDNVYTYERKLPLGFVIRKLEERVQMNYLSSELLYFVPFFVAFTFFFLYSAPDTSDAFWATNSLKSQLLDQPFPRLPHTKKFQDIAERGDIEEWMQTLLLPNLFWNDKGRRYVVGQHIAIGSLRIRTQRIHGQGCEVKPQLYGPDLPRTCYTNVGSKSENKSTLSIPFVNYLDCADLPGGASTTGERQTYHCGGHTLDIPFSWNYTRASEVLSLVIDSGFLNDIETRFFIAEFHTYTPANDLFYGSKMFVEVTEGGTYRSDTQFRSYLLWTRDRLFQTIYDCAFLVLVGFFTFKFIAAWYRENKIYPGRPLRFIFSSLWNLLDLVNLSVFYLVFAFKWIWLSASIREAFNMGTGYSPTYPINLEDVLLAFSFVRYLNAINTILMMVKFMKYFAASENLNILTRTLSESKAGLLAVLLLFFGITMGFGVAGTALYGTSLWEYRNINSTLSSLILMLVGQFDYESMKLEQRILTGLFFYSYSVLALFIYLNFLVAVVSEAFATVMNTQVLQPLEEQIYKTALDLKWTFSFPAILKRLQLIRRRKNVSQLLRGAVDHQLVPFRQSLKVKHGWGLLRKYVRTKFSKGSGIASAVKIARVGNIQGNSTDTANAYEVGFIEVKKMMPPSLHALMGDIYFRQVWDELVFLHELESLRPDEQKQQAEVALVAGATRQASHKYREEAKEFSSQVTSIHDKGKETHAIAKKVIKLDPNVPAAGPRTGPHWYPGKSAGIALVKSANMAAPPKPAGRPVVSPPIPGFVDN